MLRQRTQRRLHDDENNEEEGRLPQLDTISVLEPDRNGCHQHHRRDDECACAMSKVQGDAGVPVIRHEMPEHQRKVGDREPGAGVAHGRAHENLTEDRNRRGRGECAQGRIINDRITLVR